MKIRIFLALLIITIVIAFLPVKFLNYFSPAEKYDFLIMNCNKDGKSIFYKVLQGKIDSSDEKTQNFKNNTRSKLK